MGFPLKKVFNANDKRTPCLVLLFPSQTFSPPKNERSPAVSEEEKP